MAKYFTYDDRQFSVGDVVRVHQKIKESDDKYRTQIFEGIVIGVQNRQNNKSFTVRKIGAGGVGVERIFPLQTPLIAKIELKKQGEVRRAKLYYLRNKIGKQATKIKEKKIEVRAQPQEATAK